LRDLNSFLPMRVLAILSRWAFASVSPSPLPIRSSSLAIRLVFKFLALLRETGKIDDGDVSTIATGLIADLGSDAERAGQWRMLEEWLPDLERDGDDEKQRTKGDHHEQ